MKLPFNIILTPVLKPYFSFTRTFCQHPAFYVSLPYTYFYSTLGLCINVHHLVKHLGEVPNSNDCSGNDDTKVRNGMLVHDLKIIATSLGLVQYICSLAGCYTENPSLFLPHLAGQLIVVNVKLLNAVLLLSEVGCRDLKCSIYVRGDIRSRAAGSHVHQLGQDPVQAVQQIFEDIMEAESNTLIDQLRVKHEEHANVINSLRNENNEGVRVKLRALLVALLGVSMSACALASQPVELELEDDDVAQRLNNVSFARRITKPTIRLVIGYGKLSAFVTAATSLLLLIAVMSKQSWWRRGARWLAAPALLVAALEAASDSSDALLSAVLRGSAEPALVAVQTITACFLVAIEILVWYFIAKFFEYNPPTSPEEGKKEIEKKVNNNN